MVTINGELVKTYLENKELCYLKNYLIETFNFGSRKDEAGRPHPLNISKDVLDQLSNVVVYLVELESDDEEKIQLTQALFRALRNCVAFNSNVQELCFENDTLLVNTKRLLVNLLKGRDVHCVRRLYEFLSNLIVGNKEGALSVWEMFNNLILTSFKTAKYTECTSPVLYGVLLLHKHLVGDCRDVYKTVLNYFVKFKGNCVFMFNLLRLFLHNEQFLRCYPDFNDKQKVAVLTFILHNDVKLSEDDPSVSNIALDIIIKDFVTRAPTLLDLVKNNRRKLQLIIISYSLKIFAEFSFLESNYCIPHKTMLFERCIWLLKSIHELGKSSENCFTPVKKLSVETKEENRIKNHVLFGFKAHLVQLVGNMSCKNKEYQDKARDMDVIPVILDCCNIDARNPFILQWAIFAIRNLCDKNMENQQIIACMKREGQIDPKIRSDIGL